MRLLRLRDLGHVIIVAAALVGLASVWRKRIALRTSWPLSHDEMTRVREYPRHRLVFNGAFRDTLVLFLDYRCAYCAVVYPGLVRADAHYGVVVWHLVDSRNSLSVQAAIAAECARGLGAFHPYSYALFAKRDSIGMLSWQDYLAAAGITDTGGFMRCVDRRDPLRVIEEDTRLGQRLGLAGTPAVIFRGRLYVGPTRMEEIERIIQFQR
jgi:protein-disulfide isomerase